MEEDEMYGEARSDWHDLVSYVLGLLGFLILLDLTALGGGN
jgi:hypothetical protein